MPNRIRGISVFILCAILVLLLRLAQIQLWEPESFGKHHINLLEESVKQRAQEFLLDDGRGEFYDKNGRPLTRAKVPSLVLFPFLKDMDWDVEALSEILNVPPEEMEAAVRAAEKPFVFGRPLTEEEMGKINRLNIPGAFAVQTETDRQEIIAAQLIGVVGVNGKLFRQRYPDRPGAGRIPVGITGLQKGFDEFLIPEENSRLVFHVDGRGNLLFGLQVKYISPANPYTPLQVITTIDGEIQREAERIADRHKMKKGGIVLLDIETNSVLALVSRPDLNREQPFSGEGSKNFPATAQIPGSVFKTVIAAAAIEQGIAPPNRQFDCDRPIAGEGEAERKLGALDFPDSFAQSCNYTFAQLAKELAEKDKNLIEKYAEKLGLLEPVGWRGDVFRFPDFRQLPDEEGGRVFLNDEERRDKNFAALTGIGQKNVRITPLAAANMMAAIARGGEKKQVRFVSEIRYADGSTMFSFPEQRMAGENISPDTAKALQKLLRGVVEKEKGTGSALNRLPAAVAGKSGTAETNRYAGEKQLLNKWFVGYFPYEKPKYALAVVNLEVFADEGSVLPIFADMVKYLHGKGS
ncbi:peptidoglycan D,D-transpeptidase FtsI family protein [Caldibacillus debilis]|uniref:peptidoglycan D,D-transpeptidase FtsI family protein n=1 Tax=Caldibacillus debilis TaxID=301148 RepID=UPI000B57A9D0|nr:penicillin-binding transpeptidase domain-containing protein [Caldibacillus debilis]OUM89194.1 MAG: penicillin-binding protein [Caldibacillus debilis]